MSGSGDESRNSLAMPPTVVEDKEERKRLEVRNNLRQFDVGLKIIADALERGTFKLRPSTILMLHREGFDGLTPFAGNYRATRVVITGSNFEAPEPWKVPELIEQMCDYVNDQWNRSTPIHLSAYAMWRLNWIHPFSEGNGTTARLLSYIILSIRLGAPLPGTPTIPEQIVARRQEYFLALEEADAAWQHGLLKLDKMEALISSLLVKQLNTLYQSDRGNY